LGGGENQILRKIFFDQTKEFIKKVVLLLRAAFFSQKPWVEELRLFPPLPPGAREINLVEKNPLKIYISYK